MSLQNLMLDFTHIYTEEIHQKIPGIRRIDLSDIEGTEMYCSPQAYRQLRQRLAGYGPEGIHFIDNGNYHYMTRLFTGKIRRPYILFLFDNHTDMQRPMIDGLLSCGSWAAEMLRRDRNLRQLILVGPRLKQVRAIPRSLKRKIIYISRYELERNSAQAEFAKIRRDLPAYISIDKDVLSEYFARTNWNQGTMSLPVLKYLIRDIFDNVKVIGADICGENTLQEPASELSKDLAVNRSTDDVLYRFLDQLMIEEHADRLETKQTRAR